MSQSIALLLVPALVAAVPLLLWEAQDWRQAIGRAGAFGFGLCAWIDLVDNCGLCAENDPPLLTGGWAASTALLAIGLAAASRRFWPRAQR